MYTTSGSKLAGIEARFLGRIALLADRETATYFKITGVKYSWAAKDKSDAEMLFKKLQGDENVSLIMVTDSVYDWIQPLLARIRKEYPLVVSIPGKKSPKARPDTLAELVKRTVGIDLKLK